MGRIKRSIQDAHALRFPCLRARALTTPFSTRAGQVEAARRLCSEFALVSGGLGRIAVAVSAMILDALPSLDFQSARRAAAGKADREVDLV